MKMSDEELIKAVEEYFCGSSPLAVTQFVGIDPRYPSIIFILMHDNTRHYLTIEKLPKKIIQIIVAGVSAVIHQNQYQ